MSQPSLDITVALVDETNARLLTERAMAEGFNVDRRVTSLADNRPYIVTIGGTHREGLTVEDLLAGFDADVLELVQDPGDA